jgi:hypothetical protein
VRQKRLPGQVWLHFISTSTYVTTLKVTEFDDDKLNITVFWGMTPYSIADLHQHLTSSLYLPDYMHSIPEGDNFKF